MTEIPLVDLYNRLSFNCDSLSNKRIKSIRTKYRLTQTKFAELLGVKYSTYISWEGGYYKPSSPGRALLMMAEANPKDFIKNRSVILSKLNNYLDHF